VHNAQSSVKAKRTVILCKMHYMLSAPLPDFAYRLRAARIKAGFASAADACRRFGWKYDTYAQHENGTRGIVRAADTYAKAFKVSPAWLLTGEGEGPTGTSDAFVKARRVRVRGYVQAGHWSESTELPEDDQFDVPIPDDIAFSGYPLHAAITRGPSMNKRYPEGTVIVFTHALETMEQIEPGNRYVVERIAADGTIETTVKLLWEDENNHLWLLPESTDPRFQEPIAIEGNEHDTIRIIGKVRYAVITE